MTETITVARTCRICKKVHQLELPRAGYIAWQQGEYIQKALGHLSADGRELLISGVCGPCFDKMFPEETSEGPGKPAYKK